MMDDYADNEMARMPKHPSGPLWEAVQILGKNGLDINGKQLYRVFHFNAGRSSMVYADQLEKITDSASPSESSSSTR